MCQVVCIFCFTVEVIHHLKKSDNHCFRKKLDSKRLEDLEKAGGGKKEKKEMTEKMSTSERFSCRLGAGLIPLACRFLRKKRCREITYSMAGRPRTWRRDELGISSSWQDVCDLRKLCRSACAHRCPALDQPRAAYRLKSLSCRGPHALLCEISY